MQLPVDPYLKASTQKGRKLSPKMVSRLRSPDFSSPFLFDKLVKLEKSRAKPAKLSSRTIMARSLDRSPLWFLGYFCTDILKSIPEQCSLKIPSVHCVKFLRGGAHWHN